MARKRNKEIPTYVDFVIPTLKALVKLGGSGSIAEINEMVHSIANISDEVAAIPHKEGGKSEVVYRMDWSRTLLKVYGLIENPYRGVWVLTDGGINPEDYDGKEIKAFYDEQNRKKKQNNVAAKKYKPELQEEDIDITTTIEIEETEQWKNTLLNILYEITPDAFERLTKLILNASGFSNVEVTGKSGDGGIDGKGIVSIGGLISFHVIFQCKRYKGSVTPNQVRDFRGAMQGRADKGILITTGMFTRDAIKEATRDGAPPIDLIDGDALCYKLKELSLGVKTEMIEKVSIDAEWFLKR